MIRKPDSSSAHVLLVDLNNFARFPTLPVGLIAAALRRDGIAVEVLSPLAVGARGVPRPARARPWGYLDERLRWWSATTPSRTVRAARELAGRWQSHQRSASGKRLMDAYRDALARGPRIVLISTYLMYHEAVRQMCAAARERRLPVLLGGPSFHTAETRAEWMRVPGLSAIYAGEAEGVVTTLIEGLTEATPCSLLGLTVANGRDGGLAPPIPSLDELPYPDYDDFPWHRYPNRIVSMLSARGCQWGACRFCSDVVTVGGRSFRSRSLDDVLGELAYHRDRYGVRLFCFSDLKLNSDLTVWRGLHERFQVVVPGAKWTCAVHAGPREDEGLTAEDLRRARSAGLVRVTTGLESGSDRVLRSMRKGTSPARLGAFLRAAKEAGISTRVTAFTGYPGEGASDVDETTRFLERSKRYLDRVHLSRLSIQSGTRLAAELDADRASGYGIHRLEPRPRFAVSSHVNRLASDKGYGSAIRRLLKSVHGINRAELRDDARELEGAM